MAIMYSENHGDDDFICREKTIEDLQEKIWAISELKGQFVEEIFANETRFEKETKKVFDGFDSFLIRTEKKEKDIGKEVMVVIYGVLELVSRVCSMQLPNFGGIMKKSCFMLMFRKFIDKLLQYNLSWQERLVTEIKELNKKIDGDKLSKKEIIYALERLELLQKIKLEFFKSQVIATGMVFGVSFTLLGLKTASTKSMKYTIVSYQRIETIFAKRNIKENISNKTMRGCESEMTCDIKMAKVAAYCPIESAILSSARLLPVEQLNYSMQNLTAMLTFLFNRFVISETGQPKLDQAHPTQKLTGQNTIRFGDSMELFNNNNL